jgi:spore maturation protein B
MSTFIKIMEILSLVAIPGLIFFIVLVGIFKKVKVYEVFVEGAKEGFNVGVRIIPYLVAMLVAIGVFRASGAMDYLTILLSPATSLIGMPGDVLPLAFIRPLSGSGALAVMAEITKNFGPDTLIGRMAAVMMGSSETTFYVLAVYFGSVNVTKTRHAVPAGLIADLVAIISAVTVTNLVFGM